MDSHGATLWINIGGMSVQLTEFAKITYLIVLASFFKTRTSRRNQLVFAGWAALVFLLIMLLPDLGSAMILLPTTLLVYVVMTSEYVTTLLILLSGSVMGTLAFAIFPHVQRRLLGWSTLWTEVNDNNRQIVYGLQAIARGGLFGRGLGNGSPGGIPLANSDMIFSIVCEELGLLTGLCIVILFIVVWLRAAKITVASHDGYSSSLAFGIGTLAFLEAAIVISGTTGLLPLTGATLPLIARGGSSVLTIVILFSILIGLSARREKGGNQL
jgi:cell division protein FtsW (lipid II flippase)